MLGFIGLIGGLVLLIFLTVKGVNILIAAPFSALFAGLLSGIVIFPQIAAEGETSIITGYMGSFTSFVSSWWLMFLAGAVFGKVMEDSGAADSVSKWIVDKIGGRFALIAVMFACAILTYGGVSLFIVAFSVFPMALSLFKQADIPRRFIPASLALGSVTFTMTSAGSPEIQNWIPIEHLGTTAYAGWEVSLIVALFMMIFGYLILNMIIKRAIGRGEKFVAQQQDNFNFESDRELPNPILSLIPLLVVLILSYIFHDSLGTSALIIALLGGILTAYLVSFKYMKNREKAIADGALGAVIAIANTAAVVGFGGVVKLTDSFNVAVEWVTNLPGSPLISGAFAVAIICGLTGSSSGGQAIALPLLAPHYLDMGVDPEALHRVVAISSGSLDTLPHSGYVVTTISSIANESYKDAYPAFGAVTVILPLLGTILAIILFSIGL
ncbi:GntP family permease [Lysinibacillus sp. NPDC096418]|uniref:GntP family permease n=1 Tax=Lysinibacillus sp. NPDC096418 TaxID=3364138 RepID=UPI003807785C